MSIHYPIIRRLLTNPLRTAIVDDKRSYKSIELLIAALHVAGQVGPKCKTDTLGVLIPTSGGFPIAALAGWMLGKTVVPLNYLLKPEELQYVIDDCGTDTVITSQLLLDHLDLNPKVDHLIPVESLKFKGIPEPRIPKGAKDDDLAVLLYTSGTSGKPKGVMLSHGNLKANIRQCVGWVDFNSKDVLVGVLPQFHSFGLTVLTLLPLTIGAKVVYTARFVPHKMINLIKEHAATTFVGIPSMYAGLLTSKKGGPEDVATLKYAVSGGEPLPEDVCRRFEERFGVRINEGYGLTETAPCTNWCRPNEWKLHSVGKTLTGIETRIVDLESGEDLSAGQEGEIRFRGPNVMKGYYRLAEETAAVFDERGFFRTGDIGKLDEEGHLYITGRLKEMLIVGGENVFPREIEEVLNRHPAVHASAVLGQMDDVRGEIPIAFIELEEGAKFDETELKQWCHKSLAGYKVPRDIRVLDELPRNPTGKIMRRELKPLLLRASA